ncbi:hypothetical protein CSO01_26810 [Cellulomonas soli]|uniref:Uncharacterized protein n=1 Tax=Cellulomonas soli TaxID=931535 RepID=A0A512PFK2_9CELL|nr:hypothetical protein CSO01_26810 [Cellulomonas soli]
MEAREIPATAACRRFQVRHMVPALFDAMPNALLRAARSGAESAVRDGASAYHRILREHPDRANGRAATRQRANRDQMRDPTSGCWLSPLR